MWDDWVIDATLYEEGHPLCFVPVENVETNPRFIIGMNVLSDIEHFEQGNIRGIIHEDGQDAIEKFCNAHPEILKALEKKQAESARS